MAHLDVIREIRRKLAIDGPPRVRATDDFATVTLPERDCDAIRDLLIAERPGTVIEIGLAYGSSALAIGEALISVGGDRQVILDPFQDSGFRDAGWEVIRSAQLDGIAMLLRERSQIALPRLAAEGMSADAAFVDGSHVFHNVFVDLYYLQMIVRPGGLVILDDYWWPGVATAASYFETNLGWRPHAFANGTPGRLRALRLPDPPVESGFKELTPFWPGACRPENIHWIGGERSGLAHGAVPAKCRYRRVAGPPCDIGNPTTRSARSQSVADVSIGARGGPRHHRGTANE